MLSHFRQVRLFVTLWTVAHQAPLSMGFSRKEYWSGFPCPSPGDLANPRTEPMPSVSPALQADSLPTKQHGKPKSEQDLGIVVKIQPLGKRLNVI